MLCHSHPAVNNTCCTSPVRSEGPRYCVKGCSQTLRDKPNPLPHALQKGKTWPWN